MYRLWENCFSGEHMEAKISGSAYVVAESIVGSDVP